jgi:hypothetical protein
LQVVKVCSEIAETIKPAECQFRVGHTLLLTAVLVSVGCSEEHIMLLKKMLSRTALMLDQTRRFKKIKTKLEYHGFSCGARFFDRNLHSRSAIELHAFALLEALACM